MQHTRSDSTDAHRGSRHTSSPRIGYSQNLLHGSNPGASIRSAADHRRNSPIHQPHHRQQGDVLFGTGFSTDIRSAKPVRDRHQVDKSQSNRSVTGVFITQLDPKTTPIRLSDFIRRETGLLVRPEKLNTRYNSYGSFYIPADRNARGVLLNPSLWPRGSKLKPFYS